ncbi:ABC transporter C family [Acrasis kona]|uniref:ABC transporter C family n=1 Tax=Acrasis kona TaxID=1008807 RepID=A0AAW2ZBL2_9EUKA
MKIQTEQGHSDELSFERNKDLYPVGPPNERDTCSTLSSIFFGYLDDFFREGYKRPLGHADVWECSKNDDLDNSYSKFKTTFRNHQSNSTTEQKKSRTVLRALYSQSSPIIFWAGLFCAIRIFCQFADTFLLYALISFVSESQSQDWYKGYLYAVGLLSNSIIVTLCDQHTLQVMNDVNVKNISSLQRFLYSKLLRLSQETLQQRSSGQIVNLSSSDIFKVTEFIKNIHSLWTIPTVVIVAMILNFLYFGWATLVGVVAIGLLVPVTTYVARLLAKFEAQINIVKDQRIKYMNEILQGIRIIKYLCWEDYKKEQVLNAREAEVKLLQRSVLFRCFDTLVSSSVGIAGSAVTFIVYALSGGGDFTPAKIFTSMTIFSLMVNPLWEWSWIVTAAINANTSLKRLSSFYFDDEVKEIDLQSNPNSAFSSPNDGEGLLDVMLESDQVDSIDVVNQQQMLDQDLSISITNASFGYGGDVILNDIDLKIKRGEFVCVVGPVASGKSTLINAILKECGALSGRIYKRGKVSFCNEKPWIINASIRDNILFGNKYDKLRYENVLRVCQLVTDLERLPKHDSTEVGENGVNLSPGQQHRLSLARAAYSINAEITLLDSTLNAVDNAVQSAIVQQCLVDFLHVQEKRTVVMVTHSLKACEYADRIIVMGNGSIKKIVRDLNEIRAEVQQQDVEEQGVEKEQETSTTSNILNKSQDQGKIIVEEDKKTGSVSSNVVLTYLKGYGAFYFSCCLLVGLFMKITEQGRIVWLSRWSDSKDAASTAMYYLGIYCALGVLWLISLFITGVSFGFGSIRSTSFLHKKMLDRILHARMTFFDSNPVGRILNRFTQDLSTIDNNITQIVTKLYMEVLSCIGAVIIISYVSPWFIVIIIPLLISFGVMQNIYRRTSREVRRLESVSRSPIFSYIAESVRGVSTIRAYSCQKLFLTQSRLRDEYFCKHYSMRLLINRWIGIRIGFISSLVVFSSSCLAVFARSSLDPAMIALSVTFAMNITNVFLYIIKLLVMGESNMTSCERIIHYGEKIAIEPVVVKFPSDVQKYYSDCDTQPESEELLNSAACNVSEDWPENGVIDFESVCASYRPGLDDPVLKSITLNIKSGEKIGIVGRTGAGKSTMLLTLFRFLECSSGSISIDGLNIAHIPLQKLRSRITIIPQVPVLFSGTIRSNIDILDEYPDHVIWNALERVHMKEKVEALPLGIMEPVSEQGSNFSLGEQALLSLTRSLLKKNKIVVFDEATANVDYESDQLIQETIRKEFGDCTTITIAHRLDTIINSDRVLVLNSGLVSECGTPYELLSNPDSIFYHLASENGRDYPSRLMQAINQPVL